MSEHTPGPWTFHSDGWQPWPGAIQIVGPNGHIIAYTSSGTNEKADAPLLAAAPYLVKALEAAEAAYKALMGRIGYREYQALEDTATQLRREALAKASA